MKTKSPNSMVLQGMSAKLSVRSNLAAWHIIAAAQFARESAAIESANIGKPFGEFYQNIASCVMGSVLSSVAALEARINELFKDASTTISEQSPELNAAIWDVLEQKANILDKYDLALLLKGRSTLVKGVASYQNASALIALRNALVHFKPEWDHEDGTHKKLETRLANKFALSPFLGQGDAFFPKRCMSHGCADWSVRTTLGFMTHFCKQAGLPDRFAFFSEHLSTK
jgi:hypothetical protein